jgi:large subunit ribosomal protein L21
MYAVVKTGGKQYKVAIGDRLKVEKLAAEAGSSVALGDVLMVADGDSIDVGAPNLDTSVTATIVSHGRGEKVKVFKMRRRKNYRRTQGHRQDYTEVEITAIGDATGPAAHSAEAGTEPAPAPAEESVVSDNVASDNVASDNVASDSAAEAAADDLTRINGIGPVIAEKLNGLGITTIQQVAELDQDRIDEINEQLSFKGRIEREEWVQQARQLSEG